MHPYLRSIGFSKYNTPASVERLLDTVMEQKAKAEAGKAHNSTVVETTKEFAPGIGIRIRGEVDENDEYHEMYYLPYIKSDVISTKQELYVHKRVDNYAYTGMCDDFRLGVSLIFYLQNMVDYMNEVLSLNENADPNEEIGIFDVYLSGLSTSGKILLGIEQTKEAFALKEKELFVKGALVKEAREGNTDAIEALALKDIDRHTMVNERIKTEDLFSIVETSFYPYGTESDVYNILAYITKVSTVKNKFTGEKVCVMNLLCNGLELRVAINRNDLLGEPKPGRRFRGTIWLQGRIDFIKVQDNTLP